MVIEYKTGDMFDEPTEAIVNTVNCVGVMGKGVALEFKRRWPKNFTAYKNLCDEKRLSPGHMFIFDHGDLFNEKHRYLINFPTKQHWRSRSKIEYINDGLVDFIRTLRDNGIHSVAMPPLGCGNGGLHWSDVKPLIESACAQLPNVRFVVFPPADLKDTPEQSEPPQDLTTERASMMVAFTELEKYFGGHLTRLTAQKITYFLQAFGVDFGLTFSKQKYGPYSKTLHNAFKTMEDKKYISGYSAKDPMIRVTAGTYAASDEFLKSHNQTEIPDTIEKLSLLINGYESPYGMELLSSVHFLAIAEGISTQPEMSDALEAWNEHKRNSFSQDAVSAAIDRLREDNLIS